MKKKRYTEEQIIGVIKQHCLSRYSATTALSLMNNVDRLYSNEFRYQ